MQKAAKGWLMLSSVASAVALTLTGCATTSSAPAESSEATSTETTTEEGLTIGFIAMHLDSYFMSVQSGLEAAAAGAGVTVIPVSYDDDAGKEAQAFQDLIARQVDVIAVSTIDSEGSIAGVRSAVEAGIPVVCYNSCVSADAQTELVSAFIQSDNTSLGTYSGEYAAAYIAANLGNKATIGILNCDTYEICKLRKKGFLDALTGAGVDFTVVADQTEYIADKTPATAEAILTANPDINVAWSATDGGGTGWISAIQGSDLTGSIKVFSTDMSLALGDALKDGSILLATTGQDGAGQGAAIIEAANAAVAAGAGTQVSPYETYIPGIRFDVDDLASVDAWMADNK